MINPSKITNYECDQSQLEEMALFWLLVAGKKASATAVRLESMLNALRLDCGEHSPFSLLRKYEGSLPDLLRSSGFGCYNIKAKGIEDLIYSGLDLASCSLEDLQRITCIGPKTARCFVMHSRRGARVAGLDTHILKWLKSLGYEVPKDTPTGKNYLKLEEVFLEQCDRLGKEPAVLDLEIWNHYSSGKTTELSCLQ